MAEMAKRSPNYTSKANYLLTGLLYCGKCGAKMRYQKWDKKNNRAKLICYSQQKSKSYLIKDYNCDQKFLKNKKLTQKKKLKGYIFYMLIPMMIYCLKQQKNRKGD